LGETTNVAQSNLGTVDKLFIEIEAWQAQTKAAIPRAANPAFDETKERAAIKKLESKTDRKQRGMDKKKAG